MLPLISWDGKKKQFVIGPSAVVLCLGVVYAYLAAHGVSVPSAVWQFLAHLWKG